MDVTIFKLGIPGATKNLNQLIARGTKLSLITSVIMYSEFNSFQVWNRAR